MPKKIWVRLLLVVLAVTVLRERGYLDYSYTSSELMQVSMENACPSMLEPAASRTLVWVEAGNSYTHAVHAAIGKPEDDVITLEFEELDFSGVDFLPLFKWGTYTYTVVVRREGQADCRVSGQLDKSTRGISSRRNFRAIYRNEVNEAILAQLGG